MKTRPQSLIEQVVSLIPLATVGVRQTGTEQSALVLAAIQERKIDLMELPKIIEAIDQKVHQITAAANPLDDETLNNLMAAKGEAIELAQKAASVLEPLAKKTGTTAESYDYFGQNGTGAFADNTGVAVGF